ncbi:hypothetical protein V2J09_019237 [Rumex salicifolius]
MFYEYGVLLQLQARSGQTVPNLIAGLQPLRLLAAISPLFSLPVAVPAFSFRYPPQLGVARPFANRHQSPLHLRYKISSLVIRLICQDIIC